MLFAAFLHDEAQKLFRQINRLIARQLQQQVLFDVTGHLFVLHGESYSGVRADGRDDPAQILLDLLDDAALVRQLPRALAYRLASLRLPVIGHPQSAGRRSRFGPRRGRHLVHKLLDQMLVILFGERLADEFAGGQHHQARHFVPDSRQGLLPLPGDFGPRALQGALGLFLGLAPKSAARPLPPSRSRP